MGSLVMVVCPVRQSYTGFSNPFMLRNLKRMTVRLQFCVFSVDMFRETRNALFIRLSRFKLCCFKVNVPLSGSLIPPFEQIINHLPPFCDLEPKYFLPFTLS